MRIKLMEYCELQVRYKNYKRNKIFNLNTF